MEKKLSLTDLGQFLSTVRKLAMVVHVNPDGDAIGSALALSLALSQQGHQCKVLIPNLYPSFLSWMPGLDQAIVFEQNAQAARLALQEAEWVFCLDFNHFKRAGVMADDLRNLQVPVALIDHHTEPDLDSFDFALSELEVSSTAELIFKLLHKLGYDDTVNKEVASCLYVGIMTDTGSFSYALKNPETFSIVAELVRIGIDAERIHRFVYDTFTENRLRLLGHSINNKMMVMDAYRTAIISLSFKDLNQFKYQIGDTEGLVNYPLSMEKINFSILITERKDQIRLSFRSKGSFSVNDFARAHFDGGGHHNAAGGTAQLSLNETVKKVLELIPQYADQLNYTYS